MKVWTLLIAAAVLVRAQNSDADEDVRGIRPPPKPYRSPSSYNRPSQNYAGKPNYPSRVPPVYGKEPGPNYYSRPSASTPIKPTYNKEPYSYNEERPYRLPTSFEDYSSVPPNPTYAVPQYPVVMPPYLSSSPMNPFYPFGPQASPNSPEFAGETLLFEIFSGIVDKIKQLTNTTLTAVSSLKPIIPILAEAPGATTAGPALAQLAQTNIPATTTTTTTQAPTTSRERKPTTKKPKRKKDKSKTPSPYYQMATVTVRPMAMNTYQNQMMMGASNYPAMSNYAQPTYSQPCPLMNMQSSYSNNPGSVNAQQNYQMNQPTQNYAMNQSPQNYPTSQAPGNVQRPNYNSPTGYQQQPAYQSPQQTAAYAPAQPSTMYQVSSQPYYGQMQQMPASPPTGAPYSQNVYSQPMGDGSQYSQAANYPAAETTPSYTYNAMQNSYSNSPYPAESPAANGNYNY